MAIRDWHWGKLVVVWGVAIALGTLVPSVGEYLAELTEVEFGSLTVVDRYDGFPEPLVFVTELTIFGSAVAVTWHWLGGKEDRE